MQWLAVGDVDAASRWAQNCHGNSDLEQIAHARLRLGKHEFAGALKILEEQSRLAEAGERYGRLIEILCLRALALEGLGKPEQGAQTLAGAICLARPAGYARVFLDCGQPMSELLIRLLKQNSIESPMDASYVQNLLDVFQTELGEDAIVGAIPFALTGRQADVLRWLAEGIQNKEIAERLGSQHSQTTFKAYR